MRESVSRWKILAPLFDRGCTGVWGVTPGYFDLWKTAFFGTLFLAITTALPIYLKYLFNGWGDRDGYGYPLTSSLQQVFCTATLLIVWCICQRTLQVAHTSFVRPNLPSAKRDSFACFSDLETDANAMSATFREEVISAGPDSFSTVPEVAAGNQSWLFGPGLHIKILYLLLPGFFFAAVISLSNLGLFLVDINIHVLLRSSEIVWIVLLAWPIQREVPRLGTIVSCIGIVTGTVLISWTLEHKVHFKVTPLVINLVSSLATAFQIVTLRFAVVRLRKRDATIGVLEITAIKMSIAAVCIVPAALAVELDAWDAIFHISWPIQLLLWGGVLLTMAFQTAVVGLLSCSLATTVGILAQFKTVPQIAFGVLLIDKHFAPSAMHISGLALVVVSTVFYTLFRLYRHWQGSDEIHEHNPSFKYTSVDLNADDASVNGKTTGCTVEDSVPRIKIKDVP